MGGKKTVAILADRHTAPAPTAKPVTGDFAYSLLKFTYKIYTIEMKFIFCCVHYK